MKSNSKYGRVRFFDISTGKDKPGNSNLNKFLERLEYGNVFYEVELDKENKIVMVTEYRKEEN